MAAFDVAKVGLSEDAENGAFMPFINPRSGKPHEADGKPVGVTLRSRFSRAAQAFQATVADARLTLSRRGQDVSREAIDEEMSGLLAACTVSWTFDALDETPFPCTSENAKIFWSDPRFRAHREQALSFTANEANFVKR